MANASVGCCYNGAAHQYSNVQYIFSPDVKELWKSLRDKNVQSCHYKYSLISLEASFRLTGGRQAAYVGLFPYRECETATDAVLCLAEVSSALPSLLGWQVSKAFILSAVSSVYHAKGYDFRHSLLYSCSHAVTSLVSGLSLSNAWYKTPSVANGEVLLMPDNGVILLAFPKHLLCGRVTLWKG